MAAAIINSSRVADGSVVVEIRGELDLAASARLRDVFDTATRMLPKRIVVDLVHVTFIDSVGIGALAAGLNAADRVHVGFTVREPSAFVGAQLRQTGLYDLLVRHG